MENKVVKERHGGTGRKKIEIKKIENKNQLQITFSKRRNGLFNKAGDLCVLCGAEVAVITFSQKGRPYLFGHPSVDAVIDRFLNESPASDTDLCLGGGHVHGKNQPCMDVNNHVHRNNQPCMGVHSDVRVNKEKEEAVEERRERFWWDEPIDNMGLEELEKFRDSMEELKMKVAMRADGVCV